MERQRFHNPAGRDRAASVRAGLVLILLLLSLSSPALSQKRRKPEESSTRFLSSIEQAFLANDASAMSKLFSEREKTIVVLPGLYTTSGVFGPSQARYIMTKVFEDYATLSFAIESKEGSSARKDLIQVQCRWDLKQQDSSEPLRHTLFLRVRKEGQRWIISELRSSKIGPKRSR
ncbi:hypothetical protein ACFLU6_05165 [Acidobacteriota bacterium]